MTLPQAIRFGSTLGPQNFGSLIDYHDPLNPASCGVGAAILAAGGLPALRRLQTEPQLEMALGRMFPDLLIKIERCPIASAPQCLLLQASRPPLYVWLAHLNDIHRLSRMDQATWVEELLAERALRPMPTIATAG